MPKKTNRTVQTISLVEYCHNKEMRNKFGYIIENGVGRYICGITQKEINELFPVPDIIFYQEPTNDSPNWMRDI